MARRALASAAQLRELDGAWEKIATELGAAVTFALSQRAKHPLAAVVELFVTDSAGGLSLPLWGGSNAPSWTWIFQAATYDGTGYDLSNGLEVVIGSF